MDFNCLWTVSLISKFQYNKPFLNKARDNKLSNKIIHSDKKITTKS